MRILINGILGKMGQQCLSRFMISKDFQIIGGTDPYYDKPSTQLIRIEKSIAPMISEADVVIDFSSPDGTSAALKSCLEHKKKLITGTTGLSPGLEKSLKEAGNNICIVRANNFSIGVNLLYDFVDYMTAKLRNLNFDIELIETHHRQKKDSPSGTAKSLLDTIHNAMGSTKLSETFGREGTELSRDNQIGVHSVRGGSVVGTHEIKFLGKSENISIRHESQSRDVFIEGVILSLNIIRNLTSGYYSMKDILALSSKL